MLGKQVDEKEVEMKINEGEEEEETHEQQQQWPAEGVNNKQPHQNNAVRTISGSSGRKKKVITATAVHEGG